MNFLSEWTETSCALRLLSLFILPFLPLHRRAGIHLTGLRMRLCPRRSALSSLSGMIFLGALPLGAILGREGTTGGF